MVLPEKSKWVIPYPLRANQEQTNGITWKTGDTYSIHEGPTPAADLVGEAAFLIAELDEAGPKWCLCMCSFGFCSAVEGLNSAWARVFC